MCGKDSCLTGIVISFNWDTFRWLGWQGARFSSVHPPHGSLQLPQSALTYSCFTASCWKPPDAAEPWIISHLPVTLKDLQNVKTIQNTEISNTVLTQGKVLSYFVSLILMKIFSPYDRQDSSILKRLKKRLIKNSWKSHVFEVFKCANPRCSLKSIVWTGTIAETKLNTCIQNPLARTE